MRLDSFFHDIGYRLKITNDTKKLLDKRLASSFSLFPYITPNENLISKIIRDLLDPNGNHGQDDIFLQKFLEVIGKSDLYEMGDQANIRTEERTASIENNKRRIDILIEIRKNGQIHTGIAIENKPWATDQNKQIDDYVEHIKKCYPNYYMVYLTPSGREPPEYSAAKTKNNDKEALLTISYEHHIAFWLDACYKESRAEYVRQFLLDFSKYCQHKLDFNTMTNNDIDITTLQNHILEEGLSEQRLKISDLIFKNFEKIRKEIILSFSKKLIDSIEKEFPDYKIEEPSLKKFPEQYTNIKISKTNWQFFIGLENQDKHACQFGIGLPLKKGSTTDKENLVACNIIFPEIMKKYSNKGVQTKGWIYFIKCEKFEHWTQPEALAALHENPQEAIDYFVEEFRNISVIVESLIDKPSEVLIPCQPAG